LCSFDGATDDRGDEDQQEDCRGNPFKHTGTE
jgi:hypothetical protein